MRNLFLKLFNKKAYYKKQAEELYDIMLGAEYMWKKARAYHRASKKLHSEYTLARVNFETAFKKYKEA